MKITDVAKTYYEHRDSLVYSIYSNTFLSGGEIYDPSCDMRGRIDCSTYVHLVLQGIPYEESPYDTGNVDSFYYSTCPWADKELAERLKKGEPVRLASQLAEYFVDKKKAVFTDKNWKPGDLLFFKSTYKSRNMYREHGCYMEIAHVAIVADDPAYMYESTGYQTIRQEENASRPGVTRTPITAKRSPLFYVRL